MYVHFIYFIFFCRGKDARYMANIPKIDKYSLKPNKSVIRRILRYIKILDFFFKLLIGKTKTKNTYSMFVFFFFWTF